MFVPKIIQIGSCLLKQKMLWMFFETQVYIKLTAMTCPNRAAISTWCGSRATSIPTATAWHQCYRLLSMRQVKLWSPWAL